MFFEFCTSILSMRKILSNDFSKELAKTAQQNFRDSGPLTFEESYGAGEEGFLVTVNQMTARHKRNLEIFSPVSCKIYLIANLTTSSTFDDLIVQLNQAF